jgi:hypothetical protein
MDQALVELLSVLFVCLACYRAALSFTLGHFEVLVLYKNNGYLESLWVPGTLSSVPNFLIILVFIDFNWYNTLYNLMCKCRAARWSYAGK